MSSATLVNSRVSVEEAQCKHPKKEEHTDNHLGLEQQGRRYPGRHLRIKVPPFVYMPSNSASRDSQQPLYYQPRRSSLESPQPDAPLDSPTLGESAIWRIPTYRPRTSRPRNAHNASTADVAFPQSEGSPHAVLRSPPLPSPKDRPRFYDVQASRLITDNAPEVPPIPADLLQNEAVPSPVTRPRDLCRIPAEAPGSRYHAHPGVADGHHPHGAALPRTRKVTRGTADERPGSFIFTAPCAPPPRELPPPPPVVGRNKHLRESGSCGQLLGPSRARFSEDSWI